MKDAANTNAPTPAMFAPLDTAIVEVIRAHPTLPAVIKLAQAYRDLWEIGRD